MRHRYVSPRTLTVLSIAASLPLLCLLLSIFAPFVLSVGTGCRCVEFEDTYGKEYGVFTSPNWPAPYEDSIDCLLYSFLAAPDQLVEVTFDEFDVQKTNLE